MKKDLFAVSVASQTRKTKGRVRERESVMGDVGEIASGVCGFGVRGFPRKLGYMSSFNIIIFSAFPEVYINFLEFGICLFLNFCLFMILSEVSFVSFRF